MNKCPECGVNYDGAEKFCPTDGARLPGSSGTEEMRISIPPGGYDPLLGKTIQGRYRVIERLGEGGMGVVYVAEHVEIEKKVALKVLRDDFSKRPDVVERFRQEARAASRIGHEHIVDVTDFGQLDDGGVYFVMEYLKGCSLSDVIAEGPVDVPRAAPITQQICQALAAAHELGIVHRDLKPENIFLVQRGGYKDFVKVLDFGIAKISDRDSEGKRLTQTGMIFGTPEYMSPEQAQGMELDHRVDIYALGCIMYELFTGHVPYQGESFMAVLTQHMFEPVPDLEEAKDSADVPESVRGVVYKAMAKKVDERYATMHELSEDLEKALKDANYVVEHPDRETSVRVRDASLSRDKKAGETPLGWEPGSAELKARKRKSVAFAATIITLLLALGGGAYYMYAMNGGGVTIPLNLTETTVGDNGKAANAEGASTTDLKAGTPKEPPRVSSTPDINAQTNAKDGSENKLLVAVDSEPVGATLNIEGMGQVCSETPCELQLEQGKTYNLIARIDKRTKKLTITPSEQNRKIHLKFEEQKTVIKRGSGKKTGGKKRGPKKSDKKDPGGLKIPDLFKNN